MSSPSFGEFLRHCRKQKGLTQKGLARLAHLSHNYVTLLENGRRTNPGREVVNAIAEACTLGTTEHHQLLMAAGYGVPGEPGPVGRQRHPAFQALQRFLELPPKSDQLPTELKSVIQQLLAAATTRHANQADKAMLRTAELLGLGYFHRRTDKQPKQHKRKTQAGYQRKKDKLADGLYVLISMLADTTTPIEHRIKLVDELVSLAQWKLGRDQSQSRRGP